MIRKEEENRETGVNRGLEIAPHPSYRIPTFVARVPLAIADLCSFSFNDRVPDISAREKSATRERFAGGSSREKANANCHESARERSFFNEEFRDYRLEAYSGISSDGNYRCKYGCAGVVEIDLSAERLGWFFLAKGKRVEIL